MTSRVRWILALNKSFRSGSQNAFVFGATRDYFGDQIEDEVLNLLRDAWEPLAVALSGANRDEVEQAITTANNRLLLRVERARGLAPATINKLEPTTSDDEHSLFDDDEVDFNE